MDLHLGWNEAIAGEAGWLDELVEQASQQAGGKLSRERIREIAVEASARYAGARISAFVPILVGRAVRERLKEEIQRTHQKDETVFHARSAHPPGGEPGIEGSL